MPSPWVRRNLTEGQRLNRACVRQAEPTLGDKVAADKAAVFTDGRDAEHPTFIPGTKVPACSSRCSCT